MEDKKPLYHPQEERIKALEKAIEAQFKGENSEPLSLMFADAPVIITVYDLSGSILYANKKSFDLMRSTYRAIFSFPTAKIEVNDDIQKYADCIIRLNELDEKSFEVVHYTRSGLKLPLEVIISRVNWAGSPAIQCFAIEYSDRKKRKGDLEASERKFQQAFQHSAIVMAVSNLEEGTIVDVNDAFLNVLEYTKEEVIGCSSKQLNIYVDPKERDIYVTEVKEKGFVRDYEINVLTKTGKVIIGLVSADIINFQSKDYLLTQLVDITEMRKVTLALKASEVKFKNIVNASPMGMHMYEIINDKLIFFGANPAADRILGVSHAQFIGKTIEEAFPGLIQTELPMRYYEAALHGLSWQTEQVEYNEGAISGAYEVFAFQTEPGKMVALFNEITRRKKAEEELIKAKEKAEESDNLKTAFLQNMTHEIRTPMNAITGFAFLLDNPNLSEEKRKSYSSIIIYSSNQLLSIVNDILTISSIDTHQEKINIENVRVNQIVNDLQAIFNQKAVTKNIKIHSYKALTDQESEIYSDSTKLTQILTNLLTNALKFTQDGNIEFGYTLKDDMMEFFVKDNGIGIKAEVQHKIFERFRQADMMINKKYGGTGLGLAISKAFTELLGGKIWVDSEIGKGSTFYFTIPYKQVTPVKKENKAKKINHHNISILIVDDEELNLLFLEELLQELNIRTIRALDGREAVEVCKREPSVGLILMDIRMPIMDGFAAAKEIKKLKPDLPIIAQTAYILDREKNLAKSSYFNDYLSKPIIKDELIEKVLKFID